MTTLNLSTQGSAKIKTVKGQVKPTNNNGDNELAPVRCRITLNGAYVMLDAYLLTKYAPFTVRRYKRLWVLSVIGLRVTFGSLDHCKAVAKELCDIAQWDGPDNAVNNVLANQSLMKQIVETINQMNGDVIEDEILN